MNMENLQRLLPASQPQQENESALTPEDRRLLLGANLRLLGYRFNTGKGIFADDLLRLASLADDAARGSRN